MSGTGVQSAMRRRTRPQEEPRRSNNANMQVNSNAQVNNNSAGQVRLSANQIIFSHEVKLRDIENKIKTLGGDTITPTIDNEKIESIICATTLHTPLLLKIESRLIYFSNSFSTRWPNLWIESESIGGLIVLPKIILWLTSEETKKLYIFNTILFVAPTTWSWLATNEVSLEILSMHWSTHSFITNSLRALGVGINLYVEVLLSPDFLDISAIVNDSNPSVSIIVIAVLIIIDILSLLLFCLATTFINLLSTNV